MKKIITLILTLCLAILPVAIAEEPETNPNLMEGLILEITEEGILMDDVNRGEVLIVTDENTVWDGVYAAENEETTEEPAVGHYIAVETNGKLTRSLPPQAYALRVGCHKLVGTATELTEEGFLLTGDPTHGEVQVNTAAQIYLNAPVTVYYNGAMTMSLPGQVSALHLSWPSITGVITEMDGEEGLLITCEDESTYRVMMDETTLLTDAAAQAAQEEAAAETGIATANLVPVELAVGAEVTVIYNGMMTRSLPPMVTALEIIVLPETAQA